MSMETIVHLLRHGEVHNPDKILYGRLPGFGLSEKGHEMARIVAKTLSDDGRDIAGIVASPLQRAIETATPTAEAFGLEIATDTRLIESDNVFEGTTIGARPIGLLNPRWWPKLWNPIRPSWGEPFAEQAERVLAAAADARKEFEGREALLVSHQLPIWVARLSLEGKWLAHSPLRRQCATASLTSLHYDGTRVTRIEYTEPAAALSRTLSAGAWSAK
jgi:broad specificity phosphatase PhoE